MDGFSLSGMIVFIFKLIFAKLLFGVIMLCIKFIRKAFRKDKVTEDVKESDDNNSDNSKKH